MSNNMWKELEQLLESLKLPKDAFKEIAKEIEQIRKSLKLSKKDVKGLISTLQESYDILDSCGCKNTDEGIAASLALAMELIKIGLRPIPDVKPIGEPSGHVVWPDRLRH